MNPKFSCGVLTLGYITRFYFGFCVQPQLTNTCSKSTIETLKKYEICSKLTKSMPERLVVLVSVLFILNMNIFFSSVSFSIFFENANVWEYFTKSENGTSKPQKTYLPQFLSYAFIFGGKINASSGRSAKSSKCIGTWN